MTRAKAQSPTREEHLSFRTKRETFLDPLAFARLCENQTNAERKRSISPFRCYEDEILRLRLGMTFAHSLFAWDDSLGSLCVLGILGDNNVQTRAILSQPPAPARSNLEL